MKAITIKQPWSSFIALGKKTFETRSWRTHYRGALAIHTGAKVDKEISAGVVELGA
ncbi:ASCH domain-containing protein [Paenibacillus oralis]|uniref:ASCH domain-containing protein n=1 Tax=Paenibacillus oralis TaxID=2490856 RepID=A0A3P3U860_9BACL|nr:ASCH domain-containing protein [Paenibacillus oralis]